MPKFRLHEPRSTDATGCFWALACSFGAMFCGQISPVFGFCLLLASPGCFRWQIGKWSHDAKLSRHAKQWCQLNYPHYSRTAILDFATSFSHCTGIDIQDCDPFTPLFCFSCLDEFEWTQTIDDKELIEFDFDCTDKLVDLPHADLLLPILQDAKLIRLPFKNFEETLCTR